MTQEETHPRFKKISVTIGTLAVLVTINFRQTQGKGMAGPDSRTAGRDSPSGANWGVVLTKGLDYRNNSRGENSTFSSVITLCVVTNLGSSLGYIVHPIYVRDTCVRGTAQMIMKSPKCLAQRRKPEVNF
ncbi:hypothetical protein H4582DRAFT_2058217 [Lactarius indigo]|nr:hypothetical protein H4582DRAFT_2058217 [Lactarius indigo]